MAEGTHTQNESGRQPRRSKLPEYNVWVGMVHRCHNPKRSGYEYYGGRGIQVCQSWRDDFLTFLADVGRRPSLDHTLDRIDNNGDYEPGNVRWANRKTQNRNTRANRILEFRGESRCLTEWAEILGYTDTTIQYRLDVLGWDVERALTCPAVNNAQKDCCKRGHPFTPANTYYNRSRKVVSRACRQCRAEQARVKYRTTKAAREAGDVS